ncbi:protein FADD [Cololabis saira]|uniref:protein FADD n=1 Tax=Cololabis saira TaxID=129043 RepID=UPI002AD20D9F|nr:protein FADD [Cololabis saira]
MSGQRFNAVLLEISSDMKTDHLEKIKFLVRDHIGKRELEKITKGHELFQSLTEKGFLGPENTDYLSDLLKQINRSDLSDKLHGGFGQTETIPDERERAKLEIATEVISQNLGKNWRKLGRRLRVSDVKLESVSRRHPEDLEETAVELLKEWRKLRGAEARAEDLVAALRECQFNMTADKLETRLEEQR